MPAEGAVGDIAALQRSVGNRGVNQAIAVQRLAGPNIDSLARAQRILARLLTKHTPNTVYRLDGRDVKTVREQGFSLRNTARPEGISLVEHVTNSLNVPDKNGGRLARDYTNWVSTGSGRLAEDPVIMQGGMGKRLYRIRTDGIAAQLHDANDHFDRVGRARPYAKQREWTHKGAIPPEAVTGWVDFNKEILPRLISADSKLTSFDDLPSSVWQPMDQA